MRNVGELREILSEEIDKLRESKTTPTVVNAICNATGKILTSVRLQMEYCKLLGKKPRITFLQG